jgi:hypothetical protein
MKSLALFVLFPVVAFAQEAPAIETDAKSAFLSAFVQYGAPILFTAVAALLAKVLFFLGKKLDAQAESSKLAAVGAKFAHFAEVVVADLDATLKPQLKEATKDGVLTAAEIAQLRTVALDRLKKLAGEHGIKELQGVLDFGATQVDGYLTGLVESTVDKLHSPTTPPA